MLSPNALKSQQEGGGGMLFMEAVFLQSPIPSTHRTYKVVDTTYRVKDVTVEMRHPP